LLLVTTRSAAQNWTLQWSDEFNGASGAAPDSSKWVFETGNNNGWGNGELEFYCAPDASTAPCNSSAPNAFQDGSGNLIIQAIKTASGTWTSARMKTQGLVDFQYGRMEARMKLPVGAGLWPAFWMLGSNISTVGWPASGEIDFMENVPASANPPLGPTAIRSTIHVPGYSGGNGLGQNFTFPNGGRVDTDYHLYGAIWSPYMIQFYVDDPANPFFIRTESDLPSSTPWVFNNRFFFLLNLAVGGSWPGPPDATTPNPAQVLVDYVRVYQPSTIAGPTISASPMTVNAGNSAGTTVNLTSTAATGRVYLICSGAPQNATCSLDPFIINFSNSSSQTTTLTVTTTARRPGLRSFSVGGAQLPLTDNHHRDTEAREETQRTQNLISPVFLSWQVPVFWVLAAVPLLLSAVVCLAFRSVRPSYAAGTAALCLAAFAITACSNHNLSPPASTSLRGTPAGTYTLTITAYTVSGDTSAGSVSLTVH
jgi:beta-glucanase (GH16 family)